MPDLLIELFSEEIPARMQARACADLKQRMTDGLVEAGLTYASAAAFSTPRRLTLAIEGLLAQSPDRKEERKGPKTDAPDKAIEGFLRGAGVSRADLVERDEKKGRVFYAVVEHKGRPAAEIVAQSLEDVIRNFPWPKSMRWGAGSLRWVRPLHAILCILTDEAGTEVVPFEIDGIRASNTTRGHRFMGPAEPFVVQSFDDYTAKLKRAHVILDPAERADAIWQDARNQAFASGLEIVEDPALLAEVAGLVEWPVVLMGAIDESFLSLPPEVLQTSMREHQKFFSVRNPANNRIERFITVANIETQDDGATILAGNRKVLFARLSDAKFFWENDLRTVKSVGLEGMGKSLETVTFHNKLGSQAERVARIKELAVDLAPRVAADPDQVAQAAGIAKSDLSSEMVYEFPELQGLMGRYYAQAAGLPQAVANAAQYHYAPLGPSDDVPTEAVTVAVSLADKLDTLTGFWAIDEKPTGSKDPYALRRAALGVIRLLLDNSLRISLSKMLARANEIAGPRETAFADVNDLLSFFHDRLKVYLRDQGLRHDVIDACISMPGSDDLTLLVKRATALNAFVQSDDGENLLLGFKRANNILSAEEEKDGVEYSYGADIKFAESDAEKALFAALDSASQTISAAIKDEDFAAAMQGLAALRAPIDGFFDTVQVNADIPVLRRNRLNVLSRIRSLCLSVADLGRVEG